MNSFYLIDVHTHFFPNHIAKDAISRISKITKVTPYGNGTKEDLLKFMKKDKVNISINLPVATKPDSVHSINLKMIEFNKISKQIICFGCMHPELENFESEIQFLKENNIKGFKLHPEYQNFFPDDDKYTKFYECCVKYGMIIFFHSGLDLAYKKVHGTPKRFKEVLKINGIKIILAHMGGFRLWDEVTKYLVGKEVYFDTAYITEMQSEILQEIIMSHHKDKILFGTDFPWERASVIKQKIDELEITKELKEKIFYKNAKKLFGI